jgi:hypothetical protein
MEGILKVSGRSGRVDPVVVGYNAREFPMKRDKKNEDAASIIPR